MQMRSGAAFLGAPPERLFSRCGEWAASEAVAGTRPRDPAANDQRDDDLAFEMLLNPKEHEEFTIVRHSVQSALGDVCAEPVLLEMEKAVLKQATVQHLYSQMSGRLKPGCTEAALMAALHPTPAVCGQPQVSSSASQRIEPATPVGCARHSWGVKHAPRAANHVVRDSTRRHHGFGKAPSTESIAVNVKRA
jgi:isochorismate synthase EntC